ncbi:hypothetical protein A0J48_003370 [Sphaerospermopsis aphanizomenoides BCCUSP55]|uniref:arginine synthesis PII-interacting regulator PirA n=1 Tax=Sphaerospermopsis aphanizomenoides TaxID=459663 RepID=UPI0019061A45|nr:hypothetical protein [Sphaerospermopsis aphanizomenoides]MBK1986589.1 hypothetical protein [Sphaerospermopsis aphanizomenoides BCCUSP55]
MNVNRIQASEEASKTHKANMQKSLEYRLQIARTKMDENLVRLLEAEMMQYSQNDPSSSTKIGFFGFLSPFMKKL